MPQDDRDLRTALIRGGRLRCPACGEGKLMSGYLSVNDACPSCGAEMHHHRADDGPAWATILVTGHIIAPLMMMVYMAWRPNPTVMAFGFSFIFVSLSLWMLPRLKGLFIALQWAKRMHGFDAASRA